MNSPRRYQYRGRLLSRAEADFFTVLEKALRGEYQVFCKVRVADLLLPDSAFPDFSESWWLHFGPIALKHIDYVICRKADFHVLCAVELDDSSHELARRRERDDFVDRALQTAGIPLEHVILKSSYRLEDVTAIIKKAENQLSRRDLSDLRIPAPRLDEWDARTLCPDGRCIGTIGPNGRCRVCGKSFGSQKDLLKTIRRKAFKACIENDWDQRRLCPDGCCTGTIGKDGRCRECGKFYER